VSKATENQARSHETEHLFGSEFQKLFKKLGVVLRRRRRRWRRRRSIWGAGGGIERRR
jgi:hypothetical protein